MASLTGSEFTTSQAGAVSKTAFVYAAHSFGSPVSAPDLRICAMVSVLSKNNTLVTVTSITDNEGFTWHKAGSVGQTGINQPALTGSPIAQELEIWYTDAFATADLTGGTTYVLTVNTSSDDVDTMRVYYSLHKDIDPTEALDQNSDFPASDTQMSGSTAVCTVSGLSTDTANIQVMVAFCAVGPGQRPGQTGAPIMDGDTSADYGQGDAFNSGTNFHINGVGIYDKTAALSGATISTKDATNNQLMLAVVFTQDVQAPPAGGTGEQPIICIMQ